MVAPSISDFFAKCLAWWLAWSYHFVLMCVGKERKDSVLEVKSIAGALRKVTCALLSVVLVVSLAPAPQALADSGLVVATASLEKVGVASTSDKVNVVDGEGDAARHRHLSLGGASLLELNAKSKSSKRKVKSCKWSADDPSIAKLSSTSGKKTVVSPGAEGATWVRLKATLSDGSKGADECQVSVSTPTGSLPARLVADARASLGGRDDETSDRGKLRAGTAVTVTGSCGGRWRIHLPAEAYPDGQPWTTSYIDKSKVSIVVASVSISGAPESSLRPGDEVRLSAAVLPALATDKTVKWESSDPDVAAVDASGKVVARAEGTTRVTATAGGKSAAVDLAVHDSDVKVTLDKRSPISLSFGDVAFIGATVSADRHLESYDVEWSSSNPSVATIDSSGKVTAIAPGEAIVKATCAYGTCAFAAVKVAGGGAGISLEDFWKNSLDEDATPPSGGGKTTASTSPKPAKGKVKKAKAISYKRKVALSWKTVKGAAGYEVKVWHDGRWILAGTVAAPGKKRTVKSYKVSGVKVNIASDTLYYFRVVPYRLDSNGMRESLDCVYEASATTLPADPTDLSDEFVYAFSNKVKEQFYNNSKKYMLKYRKTKSSDNYTKKNAKGRYWVSSQDFERLVKLAQKAGFSRKQAIRDVENHALDPWSGSCFGMTTTTVLNCYKKLDVCAQIGKGGKYKIGSIGINPSDSAALLSLINYYHISQYYMAKDKLLDAQQLAKELLDKSQLGRVRILNMKLFGMGHSIVIRKHSKGVKGEKIKKGGLKGYTQWKLRMYDPDTPPKKGKKQYLYILKKGKHCYIMPDGRDAPEQIDFNLLSSLGSLEQVGKVKS